MQIVRAKYGKNSSLLHLDKLKEDSSWVWRGIYSGIEIVQQHSTWIVQCGTKINIWLDNWIIGINNPPVPIMGLSSIVNFTLYECSYNWRRLSYLETRLKRQVNDTISNDPIPKEVWKNLWKTKVSHRVQLFVWKCLKDIVPVRDIISRYKTDVEPHCVLCNHNTETIAHLLIDCPYAKEIWNGLNIDISAISYLFASFQDWVITGFSTGSNEDYQMEFATDLNVIRFIVSSGTSEKTDQCEFAFSHVTTNKNSTLSIKKWIPPEEGFIKINIDASYMFDTRKGSIGLITRDFAGKAVGVKGWNFEEEVEAEVGPEHFECKALVKAVEWMEDDGYNKVIFEMDCENVVNSICRDDSVVYWFNQHLILSVKNKFFSKNNWFCKTVNSLGNSVAHALARKARVDVQDFSFHLNYPLTSVG
ncbi:uncharacterized protein LOC113278683 [Papaver somniferum]|uniref:uncharacterized protein LOC113278683 n=1 Tax=Papaver somniferum TaxID=3469 RepID=UPI000E701AC8|nr:uncharacterized protein LOC113278683 [Papaver somniferum]